MLFFAIAYGFGKSIFWLIVIFQLVATLLTGRANARLLEFASNLSAYLYQILQFLTFTRETHPFPFSAWPDVPPSDSRWADPADGDENAPVAAAENVTDATGPTSPAHDAQVDRPASSPEAPDDNR